MNNYINYCTGHGQNGPCSKKYSEHFSSICANCAPIWLIINTDLRTLVDPLMTCDDHGILLYTATKEFVQNVTGVH